MPVIVYSLIRQPGTVRHALRHPAPKNLPKPGYYYHFKHDPSGPLNNYAYYIYGVGHHTEDNCPEADAFMQVYRPLYENSYAYRNGGLFDLRPLRMFYEPAIKDGQQVERFTRITDPRSLQSFGQLKRGCTLILIVLVMAQIREKVTAAPKDLNESSCPAGSRPNANVYERSRASKRSKVLPVSGAQCRRQKFATGPCN